MGEHTHTHTTEMRREKRCRKMGERCENIPMVWSVQMIAIYYWMKCCLLLQVVMCGWFSLSHFKHTHTHSTSYIIFNVCYFDSSAKTLLPNGSETEKYTHSSAGKHVVLHDSISEWSVAVYYYYLNNGFPFFFERTKKGTRACLLLKP